MMVRRRVSAATHAVVIIASGVVLGACSPTNVSFGRDVHPILKAKCLECHAPGGTGYVASGFDMSSYESLMKGGKFGKLINPGDPLTSALNMLVEGRANPSIRMPHGRGKLSDKEIEILRVWVKEGAKNN
jgi:Planctomycete cytochrome C